MYACIHSCIHPSFYLHKLVLKRNCLLRRQGPHHPIALRCPDNVRIALSLSLYVCIYPSIHPSIYPSMCISTYYRGTVCSAAKDLITRLLWPLILDPPPYSVAGKATDHRAGSDASVVRRRNCTLRALTAKGPGQLIYLHIYIYTYIDIYTDP